MVTDRLPQATQAIYSDLLDLAIRAEAERVRRQIPAGAFVSKEIAAQRYWYLQESAGGSRRQRYLGAETESLLDWMRHVEVAREELRPDDAQRARLVDMAVAGGSDREPAAVARALKLLSELGVFRLGAVLVGTRAFRAYGPMLGARLPSRAAQTQDIDVAFGAAVALALGADEQVAVSDAIRNAGMDFHAVPELDSRLPSTSFKIRGRELRIGFLTPARSRGLGSGGRPVEIRALGVHATPLPFLEFLLEGAIDAVLMAFSGVLVRVPDPGRFALHKLWLAAQRPISQSNRAAKDRQQALQLLEVLLEDRASDLRTAMATLAANGRAARTLRREIARLPSAIGEQLH